MIHFFMKIRGKVGASLAIDFTIKDDRNLVIGTRLYVPTNEIRKRKILDKAHSSIYAMHPNDTKMYHTL